MTLGQDRDVSEAQSTQGEAKHCLGLRKRRRLSAVGGPEQGAGQLCLGLAVKVTPEE